MTENKPLTVKDFVEQTEKAIQYADQISEKQPAKARQILLRRLEACSILINRIVRNEREQEKGKGHE